MARTKMKSNTNTNSNAKKVPPKKGDYRGVDSDTQTGEVKQSKSNEAFRAFMYSMAISDETRLRFNFVLEINENEVTWVTSDSVDDLITHVAIALANGQLVLGDGVFFYQYLIKMRKTVADSPHSPLFLYFVKYNTITKQGIFNNNKLIN